MKIQEIIPKKEYPYLAIMDCKDLMTYSKSDLLIISKLKGLNTGAEKIYIQFLNGSGEGWITDKEDEYIPLPKGTTITLTQ